MRGYRAWDVANKEMLYPDGNGYFGSEHHLSFVIDGNGEPIYIDDMGTPVEIIFLQQLGIKEKNDKDVYEGDIFQEGTVGEEIWTFSDTKHTIISTPKGAIYYDRAGFNAKTDVVGEVDGEVSVLYLSSYDGWCGFENIEVIGDIYTTPDLLKEQS